MKIAIAFGVLVLGALIGGQFFSIFVIQPIGALPEGRTLIVSRLNSMQMIDSADAWCERNMGKVTLLCRAAVVARVGSEAKIVARLPYSSMLYGISTNGKTYEK